MIWLDALNVSSQITRMKMAEDKCNDSIDKLRRALSESETSWIGDGGDAARRIIQEMIQKLETSRNNIASTASTIKKVAEEIKRRDEEAAAKTVSTSK